MAVLYSEYLGIRKRTPYIFFQLREDLLALGQLRQVADQDEIADRAVESRQDGSLADRLQDHVDNPGSNVFGRGVAVRLSEVGAVASSGRSGRGLLQMSCI